MTKTNASPFRLIILGVVVALTFSVTTTAQNALDSSTPPGQAPGAPAGAFPLGGFDTVNLFNGHLNFRLPLLQVSGRGKAAHTVSLPVEQRWTVEHDVFGYHFPMYNWWTGLRPGYGPGVLQGRQMSEGCGEGSYPTQGTTRLTFTVGDGTEYELRDVVFGGVAASSNCNEFDPQAPGVSRGTVFVTADGTSATFVSDSIINDKTYTPSGPYILMPSGYLMLRDGTRYRIVNGIVSWMRDANGNKFSFTNQGSYMDQRITSLTDSLNRQITFAYNVSHPTYGTCDRITFKGFGGATRTIHIAYNSLSNALIAGDSIATYANLFPNLHGSSYTYHNPSVVAAVWIPDGRSYQLRYNRYGELSRVDLPIGGRIEYSWTDFPQGMGSVPEINRRVTERRLYTETGALAGRSTYGGYESTGGTEGSVQADHLDFNGALLVREKHYFHGHPFAYTMRPQFELPSPNEGREYQTEAISNNGTTILRRTQNTWSTCSTLVGTSINPCITQIQNTLEPATANLVSKQTLSYDTYNNQTDLYEYDFQTGSPGALVRRTQTQYLTTNPLNGLNYASNTSIHIRNLPTQQSVYDAASLERARLTNEYDNYTLDGPDCLQSFHCPLEPRSNISGFDSSFGTSVTSRGNVTASTKYLLVNGSVTGSISSYSQFDIAGNVLKTIDPRSAPSNVIATSVDFDDRFGVPTDDEARTNSGSVELGSQISYAFPTKVTNAQGHTSYAQFDYYLGQAINGEDPNGVVTSAYFDDLLDRPSKVISAANLASVKAQALFAYDDVNRTVTTRKDLSAFNDPNPIRWEGVYDGLGRTIETRQYETASAFITVKTEYDALGRAFKTSNPFRSGETIVWTLTEFDALSRTISVTMPGNAVVTTDYAGNTVTVTDQILKKRKSVTDGLGRLTKVYEDPTNLNYLTTYEYDTLDNLTKVTPPQDSVNYPQQPQQPDRVFVYDSLKRLSSATNPESGIVSYQYDDAGNLLVKTDARLVSTHFAYDALNRLMRRWVNGSSSLTATTHNSPAIPAGVGTSDETNFFYDGQTLPSGAPTFDRGYSLGRMVGTTYGTSSNTGDYFGYDAAGRAILKIQRTGTFNYQISGVYNRAGALTTVTYPSGHVVNYNYDTAGRADSFTGNLGDGTTRNYATEILYTAQSSLAKEKFGTTVPIYNKLFYNSRGQLAEILESTSYTGPTDVTFNRGKIVNHYSNQCAGMCTPTAAMTDNNGNLKKQEVFIPIDEQIPTTNPVVRSQEYDYDNLNRLRWAREVKDGVQQWKQAFAYDAWGNRKIDTANTSGPPEINNKAFTVNPLNNRLGVPSGQTGTMGYDDAGNLTNDTYTGAGARVYDADNRMTQAWGGNSQWQYYNYDAGGQRVKRKIDNLETWQVYGLDGNLLAEYAANGAASNPQKEYGYRNGQLLVTAEPASTPPTNVALSSNGATATASSTYSGFAASGAINGDRKGLFVWQDGFWSTAAAGFPAWLEVQFNGSKTISEIDVVTLQDNYNAPVEPTEAMTFSQYGLSAYEVQYWNGSAWATISGANVSGNNKVWRKFTFSPLTTTKLRVLANAGPVDGYSRLTEVEAWTGPSPAPRYDLALGATASASSSWSSGYGASGAVNGDRKSLNWGNGGGWNDAAPSNTFSDWLQIDFGSTRTLGEIDVFTLQDNYTPGVEPTEATTFSLFGLSAFDVQYWDGSNWVTVPGGSVTGNNKIWRKFTFSAISTSKIRVVTNASPDGYSRITEVEAYEPEATTATSSVRWLVTDHLGTPRLIFDQSGSLVNVKRHDYLPFGEELPAGVGGRTTAQGYSGDAVRQKFTSKERDNETGLDYFLARYYSSIQGRFTSPDEFKGGPDELFVLGSGDPEKQALVYADIINPQSLNKYQYTFNNPLRYVDPDGQAPQDGLEARLRHDERRLAEGKMSKEEFIARRKAEGAGALVGLAILAGVRAPAAILALARWAMANPDKANQLAQEAVQLSSGNPAPGPSSSTSINLGRKLEYLLGNATGNAHNIQRSTTMASELGKIGLHDSTATRQYLTQHLNQVGEAVAQGAGVVQKNGNIVRESLLFGSGGAVKLKTIWQKTKDEVKLITMEVLRSK